MIICNTMCMRLECLFVCIFVGGGGGGGMRCNLILWSFSRKQNKTKQ